MNNQTLIASVVVDHLQSRGIPVEVPKPSKALSPDFESTIAGIPCGIVVDYYVCVPPFQGSAHLCDSSDDYYGFTEFEYTVLDRKGYKAAWLEAKATSKDGDRLCEEYRDTLCEGYSE